MATRPDLNGLRLRHPVSGYIYLVEGGVLHWIPDMATYTNLFKDITAHRDEVNLDRIDKGEDFSPGAILGRDETTGNIYLISNNKKRFIVDMDVYRKYGFGNYTNMAPVALNAIPDGDPIR